MNRLCMRVLLIMAGAMMASVPPPAPAMTRQMEQQAVQFQQQQNWQGLADLAARAVSANRKDGEAWYDAGLADDGLKRPADAIAAYRNALPLVMPYLRGSIVQLLAQDYIATGEPDQLVALYKQLTASDPGIARALRTQYAAVIAAAVPAPAAAVPDVSPRSLAALVGNLRRTWQKDAIPVMIAVKDEGGAIGFQATYDFYSPSTKTGMMVVVGETGQTRLPAAAPNWSTIPLPPNFISLAAVTTLVPLRTIQHAILFWQTGNRADPTDFSWSIALKPPHVDPETIPAMIISAGELQRLEAWANSGNAAAQYALARIVQMGLVGPANTAEAVKWLGRSASLGNTQAENKLGQYYQFGIGVPKNPQTAAMWYGKAAGAGNGVAKYNLALLYETGLGVPQNWNKALNLLSEAAKVGAPGALQEDEAIRPAADRAAHRAELAWQQSAGKTRCQAYSSYNARTGQCMSNGLHYMLMEAANPNHPR